LIHDNAGADFDSFDYSESAFGYQTSFEVTNVPAGGEWRNIEVLMGTNGNEGGGAAALYMTHTDDAGNWPGEGDFFNQAQIDKFLIGDDALRHETLGDLVSGTATATLDGMFDYVLQVGNTTDSISVNALDDTITTTLDIHDATITISENGSIQDGDQFQIFDADEVIGGDTARLKFDDASQWDLSQLSSGIIRFGQGSPLDCNGDGVVNVADFTCSNSGGTTGDLQTELNLLPGDFDGVGGVAFPDFLVLAANFGNANANAYSQGDIDGVGGVAFPDFLALAANFGQGAVAAAVPEPSSLALFGLGGLLLGLVRRRRNR